MGRPDRRPAPRCTVAPVPVSRALDAYLSGLIAVAPAAAILSRSLIGHDT